MTVNGVLINGVLVSFITSNNKLRGEFSLTYTVSYLTGDEDSRATPNLILETLFVGIYICPVSVCKPRLISAVISGDI